MNIHLFSNNFIVKSVLFRYILNQNEVIFLQLKVIYK